MVYQVAEKPKTEERKREREGEHSQSEEGEGEEDGDGREGEERSGDEEGETAAEKETQLGGETIVLGANVSSARKRKGKKKKVLCACVK